MRRRAEGPAPYLPSVCPFLACHAPHSVILPPTRTLALIPSRPPTRTLALIPSRPPAVLPNHCLSPSPGSPSTITPATRRARTRSLHCTTRRCEGAAGRGCNSEYISCVVCAVPLSSSTLNLCPFPSSPPSPLSHSPLQVCQLQRLMFKHWPQLKELALSNCGSVEKREVSRPPTQGAVGL